MKASIQDFITKIFTQINNNFGNVDNTSDADKPISTAQKAEFDAINNNLSQLEYSEVSGGKNLFNGKIYNGYWDSSTGEKVDSTYWLCSDDLIKVQPNTNYIASGVNATTFQVVFLDSNKKAISQTDAKVSFTTPSNAKYIGIYFSSNGTYSNIQIEKGSTATQYEPYIPSVKMLADKTTQIDDLNMLGWVVPEEMPIKNYVDSNGVFHQRVGRVDLGSLDWIYNTSRYSPFFECTTNIGEVRTIQGTANFFTINGYGYVSANSIWNTSEEGLCLGSNAISNDYHIIIRNTSYTDATTFKNAMQGVYLYYELATEITTNIDGNEAVTKVNDSLEEQGLLNKAKWNDGAINTDNGSIIAGIKNSIYTDEIPCKSGDRISVDYDFTPDKVFIFYYNGSTFLSIDNLVAPDNATHCRVNIRGGAINKSSARVYVNNAINELKNDLDNLFSSNITGIKLNGSTLEVSFNNGTSKGKVTFDGIAEEETIIS